MRPFFPFCNPVFLGPPPDHHALVSHSIINALFVSFYTTTLDVALGILVASMTLDLHLHPCMLLQLRGIERATMVAGTLDTRMACYYR